MPVDGSTWAMTFETAMTNVSGATLHVIAAGDRGDDGTAALAAIGRSILDG